MTTPTDYTAPGSVVTEFVTVYSPASACPEGFTTACQLTRGAQISPELRDPVKWPLWRLLQYGETAYGCCPSDYACAAHPASCVARTPSPTVSGTYVTYDSYCSASTETGALPASEYQTRFLLVTSQPLDDESPSACVPFGGEIAIAISLSLATILFVLGGCFLGRKSSLIGPSTRGSKGGSYKVQGDIPLMERQGMSSTGFRNNIEDSPPVSLNR